MKRFSRLIFVCVLGGMLTGCSAVSSSSASQTSPRTPTETSVPAEIDAGETTPPAAAEGTPDDPSSCLQGSWLADNELFLEQIRQFGDEVRSVDGRVLLRFDAGTLATDYQDWIITAVSDGVEVQITRVGIDAGTYVVTGDTVDIDETDVGSTLTVSRGGFSMTIDPQPAGYAAAPYSCDATTAAIETHDGVLRLSRL